MTLIKIQPGPADSYDSYIDEANPSTNYKTSTVIAAARQPTYQAQALIQFDLSSIPVGATITKATLGIHCLENTGGNAITCHEISQAWYIDTVDWDERPVPGLPGIPALVVVDEWTLIDVLSIVQDWITNPSYNLGFQILTAVCVISDIHIASGDYLTDPTLRPYLEITYTGGSTTVNPLLETVENNADFNTASTDWVDVTNLSITIPNVPAGAKAKISFAGMTYNHVKGNRVYLDIDVDGTQLGDTSNGIMYPFTPDDYYRMDSSFSVCTGPLSAGSHTFKLIAKVDVWVGVVVGSDSPSFLSVLIIPDITAPFPVEPVNVFPVGAVYLSVVDTSPAIWFGGTWERIAQGRCLVGLNEADGDFNTPEETGGEKTHQLTVAELASHVHNCGPSQWADDPPTVPRIGKAGADNASTGATGGDTAHNNLQPYFVVFMWKRTA